MQVCAGSKMLKSRSMSIAGRLAKQIVYVRGGQLHQCVIGEMTERGQAQSQAEREKQMRPADTGTHCSLPVLRSHSTCVQTEQIGDNSHSRVCKTTVKVRQTTHISHASTNVFRRVTSVKENEKRAPLVSCVNRWKL